MKRSIALVVFFFALWQLPAQELNVMSFNIRLNIASDSLNAWPFRKDKVASQILFHHTHLLGVQEALHDQMMDLKAQLKAYKFVGVGRKDGKEQGEYSAIFYDTTRLEVLQSETFWLAEETHIPGKKGWDAAIERIVTWAKFRDRRTKKVFYHFNTHFDHMGKEARKQSAKLVLSKVKEIAGNHPVIVTGDFNAQPNEEPIQILTDSTNRERLTDTQFISQEPHYGPTGTFNGFKNKEIYDQPIDYIFIRNGVKVRQHASLSQTWQGRFSSDHFPVFAKLVIGNHKK